MKSKKSRKKVTGMRVDDGENLPYEQEFARDIMALISSFSGKFYGKRSGDRRKKKNEDLQNKQV